MKSYKLNIEKSFEIHKEAKEYIESGHDINVLEFQEYVKPLLQK